MSREGVAKWLKVHKSSANKARAPIGASTASKLQAVAVMADWCPHCRTLKEPWSHLNGPFFTSVSQSEDGDNPRGSDALIGAAPGFPTVMLLRKGKPITTDADKLRAMSKSMRKELR